MTTQVFDSVWDAISDTPAEAEYMNIRSVLMGELRDHIKIKGWSQLEAASALGVTQPRISDLMRGKIGLFGIEALISMLSAAGLHVELHIAKAA